MTKKAKSSVPPKKAPKRFMVSIEVEGPDLTVADLKTAFTLYTRKTILCRNGTKNAILQVQVNRVQP